METSLYKYQTYANDVISGKLVACEYIKLACQRYIDWFSRDDIEFRQDKVDKAINFISHLKHYLGKFNGKSFELLPYLYWIVSNIFGFYYKNTENRVINYVYLEMARKNGKTAFLAAILLYMLVADGESGSECELLANSRQLAKICFTMCSNFLQSIDNKGKYFYRYRDSIKFPKTKSILLVLSSDSGGNDGYNSYCFLLDECHELPDSRLWDVMVSSQGMRTNPLACITTTAGFNLFGFCYNYRKTCIDILHRTKDDDSQFAAIYTIDENDDWCDENCWIKANPSLGITVKRSYLKQLVQKAKNNTSLEIGVRTKNFNQWVSSSDIWVSNDILLNSTKKINLEYFKDQIAYCGIDLASVSDLTAVSLLIPKDDKFYFTTKYYLPESALRDNSNSEYYRDWHYKGYLTITPGNVTDYDYVLNDLLKANKTVLITKVSYDSYNATQFAINAEAEGLPLEPFAQALWNFNRPTKEIERLFKSGKVIVDDNPITRYCFSNVTLKFDHNENCKPIKTDPMLKIDGVIAMIEALGGYLQDPLYSNEI